MNWFEWLSSTNLDSALVHQYSDLFTTNELQEDDIPFFNHEFLQSMGIKIAKHRLEILKLVTPPSKQTSISKVSVAAKRTKNSFTKYFQKTWASIHEDHNALDIVPLYDESTGKIDYDHHGSRMSKGLMQLKRSNKKRMRTADKTADSILDSYFSYKKQTQSVIHSNDVVSITDNEKEKSHKRTRSLLTSCSFGKSCLEMVDRENEHDHNGYVDDLDFDDGYCSSGVEESTAKWGSMFHNLKPT